MADVHNETGRSFRLVCAEKDAGLVEEMLREEGYDFEQTLHPLVRVLTREPAPLGSSMAAFFGYVYIQDRSSMLPPLALDPPRGARVLDMCASPGSKTGFLAQLVGPSGFVLANEPSRDRLATLRQNLAAMNAVNTATCSYPGQKLPLPDGSWNWIQLDPPCSGWGTADKHPRVQELWTPDKVQPLIDLQKDLLREAARLLTPGGTVLYSTCTTNIRENEEQVRWAQAELGPELGLELAPLDPFEGFVFETPHLAEAAGTLRVDGEKSGSQGFYLARLRKPGGTPAPENAVPPDAEEYLPAKGAPLYSAALGVDTADWDALPPGGFFQFGDNALFLHEQALSPAFADLIHRGFPLGRMGKGGFKLAPRLRAALPEHDPATGLNVDALAPLKALISGQSLTAERPLPKLAGLYYKGLPLGWLRVKGSRLLWSER